MTGGQHPRPLDRLRALDLGHPADATLLGTLIAPGMDVGRCVNVKRILTS
jgi:hypothetical protein